VGDACSPDELLVEDEVEVLEVELLVDPGMVCALIAPNTPTPIRALAAAPVVSRLRRRIAASRARIRAWIMSLASTR
jgi:hypothetical protein